jgi:reactive chlorine resistance protein C
MQLATCSQRLGEGVARYSVVLFFFGFGMVKFTGGEAPAIHPLLVHSPFLFWLPRLFDQPISSDIIGVIEIALAVMMASRPLAPRLSAIGSFAVAASLVVTLSFLVTTPSLDPALSAFIVKDVTLLGVALWSAGEALAAKTSTSRAAKAFTDRPAAPLS